MYKKTKSLLMIILLISVSIVIFYLINIDLEIIKFFNSKYYNLEFNYQIITLLLAFLFILLSRLIGGKGVFKYLNLKNIDGKIKEVKIIGINPKNGESWINLGLNFSIIITFVTVIVIYFQLIKSNQFSYNFFPLIFYVLIFSLMNSFTEEIIYRFSITSVFQELNIDSNITALLSGAIFGIVHYFGTPGGIAGVIMAFFIGWFLSKSIIETKGFFWAWFIHFLQDIIIFYGLFSIK